jgi:hypothetical protein
MNIHIRIFKEELEKYTYSLMHDLRSLCYETQEPEDACCLVLLQII